MKILLLIALVLICCVQTISLDEYQELQRTVPSTLFSEVEISAQEHYPSLKKIVFITPWNKHGYEYTTKYASKLDFVSPCWYSFILDSSSEPVFQNVYNYDHSYVQSIRSSSSRPLLVPRIYVQGSQISFFKKIGSNRLAFVKAVQLVSDLMKQKQFDGIVWDSPYNFFEQSRNSLNSLIVQFLSELRKNIPKQSKILFNMANPMDHMNSLDLNNYRRLPIDYLLIQNYDKHGSYLAMISKSIEWMSKASIKAPLILMLPFFSVQANNGQAVSTEQAIKALKAPGKLSRRISQGMCLYGNGQRKYYVPCFNYFRSVFELAEGNAAGVGFWEGGNGLQNYYKFL